MYKKFTARWYLQSSISDVIFVYLVCKCAAHVLGLACKSCLRLVLCDIAAYHLNSLFFTIAEDSMIYVLQYLKCCFISFPLYLSSQNIQTDIMRCLLLVLPLLAGVVHGQDDCSQVKSEFNQCAKE